jgi:hypothetical protein
LGSDISLALSQYLRKLLCDFSHFQVAKRLSGAVR